MSLSENQAPEIRLSFADDAVLKQRRQMFIALTLLLVALVMILTKDRDFWFPSAPVLQSTSEPVEETSPEPQAQPDVITSPKQTTGTATLKAKQHKPVVSTGPGPASAAAPVVVSRTVLPPLEVEVVAGDQHRTVQAGSNSVQLDLRPPSTSSSVVPAPPASDTATATAAAAATRVHLSPSATQTLSRPVEPNYPLLAREMKIQGAVVLEVLIGREGIIQHLRVLSGPAILSAAAQEAVKQWRFRPYLQSGQPVETEARITVNFTIFTQ
jgi:periplasmic protein TonB